MKSSTAPTEPQPAEVSPDARDAALRALIADGLMFADVVRVMSERNTDADERHISYARDYLAEEGHLEFDDHTICSGSSDYGDYVLGWTWVSGNDIPADNKTKENDQ
jgi:hypothetical protein